MSLAAPLLKERGLGGIPEGTEVPAVSALCQLSFESLIKYLARMRRWTSIFFVFMGAIAAPWYPLFLKAKKPRIAIQSNRSRVR
jgi:hypothetical protein